MAEPSDLMARLVLSKAVEAQTELLGVGVTEAMDAFRDAMDAHARDDRAVFAIDMRVVSAAFAKAGAAALAAAMIAEIKP